jgi:hypothetical protein
MVEPDSSWNLVNGLTRKCHSSVMVDLLSYAILLKIREILQQYYQNQHVQQVFFATVATVL